MPNSTPYPNPEPVRLRRATSADIPRMREIEQSSETAAHWSADQYDALFAADGQERVALIAAEESVDTVIHGFLIARCLPGEWEIENVIVEGQYRQRGVGSFLVRELLQEARTAGAVSVILEVRESNRAALQLYKNIGFKQDGRRNNYYHDPLEDALLYRIKIAEL